MNAASMLPVNLPNHGIAPGSIASVFGTNLATSTVIATTFPLPLTLAGTSVTVNGTAAPLFYISPTQIDFQVPSTTTTKYLAAISASVVITTGAGVSLPVQADVFQSAQGIFTVSRNGCGQGAVLNATAGGTSANSSSNSASPGDSLEIFGTGIGAVSNPPPDGSPPALSPLTKSVEGTLAIWESDVESSSFSGRAPGLVGVDQINAAIPLNVRQGCSVPLAVGGGGGGSQPVTVSIRSGGGQCQDPPTGSGGLITVKRSVVLNDPTVPEADTITAVFSAAPGKQTVSPFPAYYLTPCLIPGYSYFGAGAITASGSALAPIVIQPTGALPNVTYNGSLPAASIAPGTFQLSALGSPTVGSFLAPFTIGEGIQVTSVFAKGSQINPIVPLTVNWTGGQPGNVVTVTLIGLAPLYYTMIKQAPATAGTIVFDFSGPSVIFQNFPGIPLQEATNFEIDVQVRPDPALPPQTFMASGLTLGGQVVWNYLYRFIGLSVP